MPIVYTVGFMINVKFSTYRALAGADFEVSVELCSPEEHFSWTELELTNP